MSGRVLVIGGGAAGLICGGMAGEHGFDVTIIERNPRPARKLMITGKGRCNLTNNSDIENHIAAAGKNGRFLYTALANFSPRDVINFFENLGVPLKTERGERVFPVSDKAVDIVDALTRFARKNAKIIEGRAVSVQTDGGKITSVSLEDGRVFQADKVIIATGGLSYPATGSTGDGYEIARKLGHTVTPLRPSLVGLECREGFCSDLAGLTLKNIGLTVFRGQKKIYSDFGELLFTHKGVSGPTVLSASKYIEEPNSGEYIISIDLKPALSPETLDRRILRDLEGSAGKLFKNSLSRLLPQRMIPAVLSLSDIDENTRADFLKKEDRKAFGALLKDIKLHVTAARPFTEAVVTAGGVALPEVDPRTMRSRLIKGLYFAGEVLDLDSRTGGFNLQIAFSTGALAAKLL